MMIETTQKLKEVCDRFAAEPFVCVDTEFIREKTYFPIVCLIQIATDTEAFCIDPLSGALDLQPLMDLMVNPNVVKVFHAARQDVEIFYHLMGKVPTPLFDTQIGAMVCGFRDNVGYQEVVNHYVGVTIDKSMRFTDWSKRPLSEKQAQYALCDVTYLASVYLKMKADLETSGRLSWIEEEMAELYDTNLYAPTDAYVCGRIKYPNSKPEIAKVYQALYLWREHKARDKNRPRRHILRDELMQELAVLRPKTADEMKNMRGISQNFERSVFAVELLDVIQKAKTEPPLFAIPKDKNNTLSAPQRVVFELLKTLLTVVCEENGVAAKLVADTDDLTALVRAKSTRLTTGWRGELFGKHALLLKQGKLLIGYDTQRKKVCLVTQD